MKKVVQMVFLLALAPYAMAQRTCATTDLQNLNKSAEQINLEKEAFETWLHQKRAQLLNQNALQGINETTIYTIPVVVHIIHTGEPIGLGYNITDEQIASQIEVLNQDFRHLNADSVNTPINFQPLMADIGFEFVLAKRDPAGLPTNGITRTNGNQSSWSFGQNAILKSLSIWSTTDYLNIWVAPLSGGFLGWAEFPTSTILDGINSLAENNPDTDGVVIKTTAFGNADLYPQGTYINDFNLGRTATHEIGHFFGLRHMDGDGDCTVDDYVDDTPATRNQYSNCPLEGAFTYSCGAEPSMFMNYMDYVDDDCMNLFSLGQKDRMVIVVNNSPRRASLLTSLALIPPPNLDAAITDIPSPDFGICTSQIFPSVTVKNTGTVDLTKIDLSFFTNGSEITNQTFNINLSSSKDTILYLSAFNLTSFGLNYLKAVINSVNDTQDNLAGNNVFDKEIFNSEVVTALNEDFTNWPMSWAVRTDAPVSNWNYLLAPNLQIENTAAVLSYYQQNSPFFDHLITPALDLSEYSNPKLLFDHAYGERLDYDDKLAVLISVDCGTTFLDTLFIKSGGDLATTDMPIKFTPSGPIDWQTNIIDLTSYKDQTIQIAFVGSSAGGNNIYLDNFIVVEDGYQDIAIKGLINEAGVYSSDIARIGLMIENSGTATLTNMTIEISEAGNTLYSQPFDNLSLDPGTQGIVYLDNIFTTGKHQINFRIVNSDDKDDNNQLTTSINVFTERDSPPFRERFNSNNWIEKDIWSISSPNDEINWQEWALTADFLYYPAYSPGSEGLHDWLVLPLLDFSKTDKVALEFKVAYASNDKNNELLRVWLSTNGGESFDHQLQSLSGNQLATSFSNTEWFPQLEGDWQTIFQDLSEFAGAEQVLIAFESTDGDGNNIYLDDIELFVSDIQNTIEVIDNQIAVYPNPVTNLESKITFNLDEKQDIQIRILDVMGKIISNQNFIGVLNQTFPLEIATNQSGIYILQASGASYSSITRIMVSK